MIETAAIETALAGFSADQPLELTLVPAPDHPLTELLAELAEAIAAAGGERVILRRAAAEVDGALPARPALLLGRSGRSPLRYLALPEGQETAPFFEAVSQMGTEAQAAEPWAAKVAALDEGIELMVFIATTCPNCPHAVRAATQLSLVAPAIRATVIDAQHFPELAKTYGARSVPLTVVDGGLSITGALRAPELAERLLERGTSAHEARLFASLIEVGRFAAAAERLASEAGGAAFMAAWRVSALSDRMGLMMAAEEALEEDVAGLDPLLPGLVDLLAGEGADAALRGDTADLLGKIGLPAAKPSLEALLTHANPDVVEIAEEALEAIAESGRG